ncbi:uncharacterized protein LOC114526070 [Dendronephthya gigantea]|uniref:uncharacterized protein LOC114526070 n=1 Tax=Dendronephthya gigantea TaxID=151771 RepID=UPI00106BF77A|nr:uncharacterized protein LOC114526070 [Dendronephthya gigantea]XP_028403373.1 uncharacterized protein LOC114526070 [Dendronephthya gigantea]
MYFLLKSPFCLSVASLILMVCCQILLASSSDTDKIKNVESHCGCRVMYKPVGCEKDKRNDRALPEMLIDERDRSSSHYNGFDVDWDNWDEYLPAFTCRCAEAAMKKGYKYFGLQYWGECWSGPSPAADNEYDKHGPADECYDPQYERCAETSTNCVGAENENFVYEIQYFNCPVKFERVGCYKDNGKRPLTDEILTDRQKNLAISSGKTEDWKHFYAYLPDFACRCATKTVDKGWDTFGVQYYGECWSGENGHEKYAEEGESSTCVNGCFEPCGSSDPFCTGKEKTNFVYRVI